MSLVINHNLMAMNAARNLGTIYGRLATSTQRLSSGLRINSAGDDAAGLAIRELMRSDIAVMQQGIRNAYDGISMIQTAEGAMAVIDEKLTRMKELAEQAATGTYTTIQREIMNSEYQAMADEIDRIANATDFNQTKLLDGSISTIHGGSGMKIHFGTGNDSDEDYYFVTIGDVRATSNTGLRVGGDAKNDIWGTVGTNPNSSEVGGCCGGGITSLTAPVTDWTSGDVFAYGYNWDLQSSAGSLTTGQYIAGLYQPASGASLQDLLDAVNQGTQSRVRVDFDAAVGSSNGLLTSAGGGGAMRICLHNDVYYVGSTSLATVAGKNNFSFASSVTAASALTAAINTNSNDLWAMVEGNDVYVFSRTGGDHDDWLACDEQLGAEAGSATAANLVNWYNPEAATTTSAGTTFSLGGENWGVLTTAETPGGSLGVKLNGRDVGDNYDLQILNVGSGSGFDLSTSGLGLGGVSSLTGFDENAFSEIQDAADGAWDGAHIRTQSAAQEALAALDNAILRKDVVRANLGAIQNRLENTITNLQIQAENLQTSESRISDVDVATEMTEFTRNNILAQAATAMLAQANSIPQLALTLLG